MGKYVYVRLIRPEGYEETHPDLVIEDAGIHPAFEPEAVADFDTMIQEAEKRGMLKAEEIAEIVKCAPVACSSGNSREHIELVKKAIRQAADK